MKTQAHFRRAHYPEPYGIGAAVRECPVCHAPVDRIHRRFIDRILNLFRPSYRYRCRSKGWGCEWEGNLR